MWPAVKEKIVQASQVNESAEDSAVSNAGAAPIVEEVTDTVTYAESAKTETGKTTTYTAKLSSSGHLLLSDGTETPYLPVYKDGTKDLAGAKRDRQLCRCPQHGCLAARCSGCHSCLLGSVTTRMSWAHHADDNEGIMGVDEDVESGSSSASGDSESTPTPTPEPDGRRLPRNPKRPPPRSRRPRRNHTAVPPPRSRRRPRRLPPRPPTEAPTAALDRTAGFPDEIEASKDLAGLRLCRDQHRRPSSTSTPVGRNIDGATYYYDPADPPARYRTTRSSRATSTPLVPTVR